MNFKYSSVHDYQDYHKDYTENTIEVPEIPEIPENADSNVFKHELSMAEKIERKASEKLDRKFSGAVQSAQLSLDSRPRNIDVCELETVESRYVDKLVGTDIGVKNSINRLAAVVKTAQRLFFLGRQTIRDFDDKFTIDMDGVPTHGLYKAINVASDSLKSLMDGGSRGQNSLAYAKFWRL